MAASNFCNDRKPAFKPGLHIRPEDRKHMFVNTFLCFPSMPLSLHSYNYPRYSYFTINTCSTYIINDLITGLLGPYRSVRRKYDARFLSYCLSRTGQKISRILSIFNARTTAT